MGKNAIVQIENISIRAIGTNICVISSTENTKSQFVRLKHWKKNLGQVLSFNLKVNPVKGRADIPSVPLNLATFKF